MGGSVLLILQEVCWGRPWQWHLLLTAAAAAAAGVAAIDVGSGVDGVANGDDDVGSGENDVGDSGKDSSGNGNDRNSHGVDSGDDRQQWQQDNTVTKPFLKSCTNQKIKSENTEPLLTILNDCWRIFQTPPLIFFSNFSRWLSHPETVQAASVNTATERM